MLETTKEFMNVLQITCKVKGYARYQGHYKLRERLKQEVTGFEA